MKEDKTSRLERAEKRVKQIKGFYNHLMWYIIINLILLVVELRIYSFFNIEVTINKAFENWMNWNFIVTPILWGIGLAIHGLAVFGRKFSFFENWEKRQIKKYMQDENKSRWE